VGAQANHSQRTSIQPVLGSIDGWTLLGSHQVELAYRYLEIMREMNRESYSPPNPDRETWRMTHLPCEYFYFPGTGFELTLGFKWIRRLQRYRVMSTGFVGMISPREALDRIACKMREFAQRRQVDRLVAIRPHRMDSSKILQMYGLLKQHPGLRVRGGHYLAEGEYLWISFPQ